MKRVMRQRKRRGVTRMASSFVRAGVATVPILRIVFAGGARILRCHGLFPSIKILKILLCVVGGIAALTIFGKVRQKIAASPKAPAGVAGKADAKDPGLSPAGFFLLSRDDASNPRVTIMSPPNCPGHEAMRARELEASLQAAGIPCEMKQEIGFNFTDPDDMARVNKYMGSVANPLVLVRGWAKGNPLPQDVIAQYQSGR